MRFLDRCELKHRLIERLEFTISDEKSGETYYGRKFQRAGDFWDDKLHPNGNVIQFP